MIYTTARSLSDMPRKSTRGDFRAEVLRGLRAPVKELPCKYFYDDIGSQLFERITELNEYYLTRSETSIMQVHAPVMAHHLGPRCLLVEYGSGSSAKTRLLLDHLPDPAGYVPIDVSCAFLHTAASRVAHEYPELEVLPLCADFCGDVKLPEPTKKVARRVVYFPGSTIGNFGPAERLALLKRTAKLCGPGGGLLLGADLRKDTRVLESAYNDAQGVTAAFNRNLLKRINRELGADFIPWQFDHRAFYNAAEGRIEMHLVSLIGQHVRIGSQVFYFFAGETVRTEYSYKFDLGALAREAETAGFHLEQTWTDSSKYFSVNYFEVAEPDQEQGTLA